MDLIGQSGVELMMPMRYSATAIANFFIGEAIRDGKPISPMKVKNLVYLAHGWNLAINNDALINEQVEAGEFGPVIDSLYESLAEYGNEPITEQVFESIPPPRESGSRFAWHCPEIDPSDEDTRRLLEKIVEVYGKYTAVQLSNLTHSQGSPWRQVYDQNNGNPPCGTDIPADLIRDYFIRQAAR